MINSPKRHCKDIISSAPRLLLQRQLQLFLGGWSGGQTEPGKNGRRQHYLPQIFFNSQMTFSWGSSSFSCGDHCQQQHAFQEISNFSPLPLFHSHSHTSSSSAISTLLLVSIFFLLVATPLQWDKWEKVVITNKKSKVLD